MASRCRWWSPTATAHGEHLVRQRCRGSPRTTTSRCITPEDPNTAETAARVAACRPDFLFSFYYRHMLEPALLRLAARGAYNMHGSLLPKYRGRVPVNWAVITGERETGATLHAHGGEARRRRDRRPAGACPSCPTTRRSRSSARSRSRPSCALDRRAAAPDRRRCGAHRTGLGAGQLFRRRASRRTAASTGTTQPNRSTTSCAASPRPIPARSAICPGGRAARAAQLAGRRGAGKLRPSAPVRTRGRRPRPMRRRRACCASWKRRGTATTTASAGSPLALASEPLSLTPPLSSIPP